MEFFFLKQQQQNSQSAGVSWCARAFPSHVVTCGTVLALALLLTAVSVGSRLALRLTPPTPVAGRADTGAGDGVTQCRVLTLAAAAAVGAPVAAVTGWRKHREEKQHEEQQQQQQQQQ